MKTIKEAKRLVAIFLTVTFMMPTIYSCTKENNSSQNEYQVDGRKIIEGINLVKNSNASTASRNDVNITITQEMVDEFSVLLGYNEGDISAESLNSVMVKYAEGKSYSELMEEYNFSNISKIALENIKEGNTYENLEDYQGFVNLDENEKEIITMSNSLMKAFNEYQSRGPHTIQEATGALLDY